MTGISRFRAAGTSYVGAGARAQVGEEAKRLGGSKALVVSDPGIKKAGWSDAVAETLTAAGIGVDFFTDVDVEPSTETVRRCVAKVREGFDVVVGVGGGSSMDTAKAGAVLAKNGGDVMDYFGVELIPKGGVPFILMPTTGGTGAEATPNAIFAIPERGIKSGLVSPYLLPAVAIVDPEMAVTCPPAVTAATGMDALVHAIESYVSNSANFTTDCLNLEAIGLISGALRTAYARGADIEARTAMARGSWLAGVTICNAGVGAVHALAYPLGGTFHVSHGVSNTLMLPWVMEYNLPGALEKFADIAAVMGKSTEGAEPRRAAEMAVEAVRELAADLGVAQRLSDIDIPRDAVPALAEGAMTGTRLLVNNPWPLAVEDAAALYERAY